MKYKQEEKGITLVALVVTIIIMLILTAVTLSATIGKNGLVESALNARAEESKKEALDEVISGIKRLEYYEQAVIDRGVIVTNIYTIAKLQKYIDGKVNGIRINPNTKKPSTVFYTNRNGTYTIFFNEDGSTTIQVGTVVEKNQENTFELEKGDTISLTSLNEDIVSWGVEDEYKDIIQIDASTGIITRKQEGNAQVYGVLNDGSHITINIADIHSVDEIETNSIYVFYYDDIKTLVFNNKNEGLKDHQLTDSWYNNADDNEFYFDEIKSESPVIYSEVFVSPWDSGYSAKPYLYNTLWKDYVGEITTVNFLSKISPKYTRYWFTEMKNLTSIVNISNLNLSRAEDISYMFKNASKLANLDLSGFNTSNVTNMRHLFCGCSSLESLDLSSFNTSNVTDMCAMFEECKNLTNLDVSKFNTGKVTNMACMFLDCKNLTDLNLGSLNTSKVTNMAEMFQGCRKLNNLNLKSFDTSKVTNMSGMFDGCWYLESIDLSGFNTSSVTDMMYMFYDCSSLTNINLSGVNTSNVTHMNYMFSECSDLTNLNLTSFDTSEVVDMREMFSKCGSLTQILVGQKWEEKGYTNDMFDGCGVDYVTLAS